MDDGANLAERVRNIESILSRFIRDYYKDGDGPAEGPGAVIFNQPDDDQAKRGLLAQVEHLRGRVAELEAAVERLELENSELDSQLSEAMEERDRLVAENEELISQLEEIQSVFRR